jgi:hypothetical protein
MAGLGNGGAVRAQCVCCVSVVPEKDEKINFKTWGRGRENLNLILSSPDSLGSIGRAFDYR